MIDKRDFVAGYCVQDFNIDDGVALIDAWEKVNGAKPTLSEVLAKVEKRAFWDYVPGRAIRIEDLEDVLSEYFA